MAATTERSLRDFGATFHNAIAPKQVMVWAPEQAERAERSLRDADWWNGTVNFGSCLKDTGPGDRGAVYETGGSGIVGFYDFSGRAGTRRNQPYRYMAAGVYRPLAKPISYAHLLDDDRLEPLFGKIQGKAALTDEEAQAIMELAGRVPKYVAMPLPEWAEEPGGVFERDPDSLDPTWASEHELHMRIISSTSLWKKLGFKRRPRREIWSADRKSRYDVIGFDERIVVEVKLKGDMATLRQTDRYLDTLRRERGEDNWRAHIVVAKSADTALRRAARQRAEITVWKCERGPRAQKLVEFN